MDWTFIHAFTVSVLSILEPANSTALRVLLKELQLKLQKFNVNINFLHFFFHYDK